MPSSVRFILILFGLAVVGAVASLAILARQDAQHVRIAAEQATGGDVDAGRTATVRYGCVGCHAIHGATGPSGQVGPSLDGFASRAEIAGLLANQPGNLIRWLRHPQEVLPGNGMPDQRIGEADARDLAAYLYTLQK